MTKLRGSARASRFTESVIREMTRLAQAHGAVNLSQGFPDFPAPSVSPGSVVLALSISLLIGLVAGGYPANRAARLRPIEALRYQ